MATDKRERQRENRAQKQSALEAEQAKDKKSGDTKRFGYFAIMALVALGAIFFLTRDDDDSDNVSTGTDAEVVDDLDLVEDESIDDPVIEDAPADDAELVAEDDTASVTADPAALFPAEGDCPAEDGSGERITSFDGPQPLCIDLEKNYTAEIVTNAGDFTIEFDTQRAPVTVNNFVTLARHGYYEGVNFHRVIPGFMIQGGDAVGTPPGTGGPGYSFNDEPQGGEGPFYEVGSVAMANSGPNTNGSQFFVVTGPSGEGLPDQYTRFGSVTVGMETITAIEAVETAAQDAPVTDMTIESITIIES